MAYTNPRTWTDGELVDETIMNVHVRDNLNAIVNGTTGAFQNTAVGPHAIGATVSGVAQLLLSGTYPSDGSGTAATALRITSTVTGANGDTSHLSLCDIDGAITTQSNSETIANVQALRVDEPVIAAGTDTITHAATVYIAAAPTEGDNNYYLLVGAAAQLAVLQSGNVGIGDAAPNATLSINQGAADDLCLGLKSSDVATGLTTAPLRTVETDDYCVLQKRLAASGGVILQALHEDAAGDGVLTIKAYGGTATTAKTTAAIGLIDVSAAEHDGANALADITADGNVFTVRARVGASEVARLLVDEDGDLYSVTAAQTFDDYDDLALVEAFDRAVAPDQAIRDDWAGWARYNEEALVEAKILGAPVAEGGLTNVTQLQRLHNGTLRQLGRAMRALTSDVETMRQTVATLQHQLNART